MTTETTETNPETAARMEDTIKQIFDILIARHSEDNITTPLAILDIVLCRLLTASGDLYGATFKDVVVAMFIKRLSKCRSA